MVLWVWAITNLEGVTFPRRLGLMKEKFCCSSPESLGFSPEEEEGILKKELGLQRTTLLFSRAFT